MHRHYCSLWDRNYCAKGLSLHASLLKHSSEPFTLHVLCLDKETWSILYDLQLENVELMWMAHFEQALHMEPVKASRSKVEYFWTCASSLMEYLLPWMDEDGITYLDSDLYFFSDPQVIFDEIADRSLGITPHRFPASKKHMERNGIYNVAWVTAKNTPAGQHCISQWAKQCREWCFAKNDGPRFGDQKYLDYWPHDYPGNVCSIQNIGVNVAPWNVSQWEVTKGPKVNGVPVVFYHLHEYQDETRLTNYALRGADIEYIYRPYIQEWIAANERIRQVELANEERQKAMQELPVG